MFRRDRNILCGRKIHYLVSTDHSRVQPHIFTPITEYAMNSSAISWAIYSLCSRSEFQCLLRDEVCASPTDTPTYDELNALPFLDAVVRETMRFHTPVPGTARMALEDTVLPLSEPYVDVNGVRRDSILYVSCSHSPSLYNSERCFFFPTSTTSFFSLTI